MLRLALGFLVLAPVALAGEGKWTPQQVQALGPLWVKQQGFTLPLDRLWDPAKGTGLLANAVQLPGCSGSFISSEGLLITNHHCVVGILQEHSTPQRNLVRDGFVARSRDDEKPAKAFRLQVPRRFVDVTAEVLAAVPAGADDLARFQAVEAKQKALVAQCEQQPGTRCTFASFDGGLFFTLTEFTELSDVRLVYAPPEMVGNFGGETDNWSWPRHTGDFALLRAYADGKPFAPPVFFPVSAKGVKPGDAVAVLGYPGVSYRAWLADEMAERRELFFPRVKALASEWIRIVTEEGARAPESAIATADELRSLLNRRKNAEGQLVGMARGELLEKQRAAEEQVRTWALKRTDQQPALEAYEALTALAAERRASWERDFLLDAIGWGPRALSWPVTLVRRATEAAKPDAEREPGFQQRDLARLKERLERDQKRYSPPVDVRLFESWVVRALELPEGQRLASVEAGFGRFRRGDGGAGLDRDGLRAQLVRLIAASAVFDASKRLAMFDETPEQLRARKDPLLELGFALDAERLELKARRDRFSGATLRARPAWRRAVIAHAGRPVAPDANSTLRVTFGRVQGYAPREALTAAPQTTLSGMVQKHLGEGDFDVPASVRAAHAAKKLGRWRDPLLGDVPVDFLADCDTTGGNSGSPTIDGAGRLVGVNFDRVWENVANDFGYNPAIARNVNADVRFLLWLLEEVEGARPLLVELGVAGR
ncbi:MAG: S46 family peptidase [Myxococcaceae bacterium]|nr:S46 family peptidase [Myxococcaceae bacterium]MCA3015036.1 S46 family peptidase [Myxococcaceae bacterium]